jgi:hypothetical protein
MGATSCSSLGTKFYFAALHILRKSVAPRHTKQFSFGIRNLPKNATYARSVCLWVAAGEPNESIFELVGG